MTNQLPQSPSPTDPRPEGFQVTVQAQYVKDLSFESPNAPQIFAAMSAPPSIQMTVNVQTRSTGGDKYEVVLVLKIEAKIESKTAFIAELAYGGVFSVPAMPEDQLKIFLLVEGPRILFPFARSALSNAIRDGGFPYVIIQPVDFMALFLANRNNVGTMPAAGAA
ncbi:MAG: protein-export chaperone SecB [Pseudomonadota bacterium]|nr:protein-export chaperone SecB [Pseudomonadota bacterium]